MFLQSVGMALLIMPVVQKQDSSYRLHRQSAPFHTVSIERTEWLLPTWKNEVSSNETPIPEVVILATNERQII